VKTKPFVWVAFITVSSAVFLQGILIRVHTVFSNSVRLLRISKGGVFPNDYSQAPTSVQPKTMPPFIQSNTAIGYETI